MEPHFSSVHTGVDSLITLLHSHKMISIDEAAKRLSIPASLLRNWVDLLVEEGIVGIEYKFVTPYIYLVQSKGSKDIKDEFYAKATAKHIPREKIKMLWHQYLVKNLTDIREEFYLKARSRSLPADTIDRLWKEYHKKLQQD